MSGRSYLAKWSAGHTVTRVPVREWPSRADSAALKCANSDMDGHARPVERIGIQYGCPWEGPHINIVPALPRQPPVAHVDHGEEGGHFHGTNVGHTVNA